MTLRSRLTAAFLLVVLVPLLVGVALVAVATPATVAARQEQGLIASARLAASVVAEQCARVRGSAEAVARAAGLGPAGLQASLDGLLVGGNASGVRVTDRTGKPVASAGLVPDTLAPPDCADGAVTRAGAGASAVTLMAATVLTERRSATSGRPEPSGAALATLVVDDALAGRLRTAAGTGEVVLLAGGQAVASSGPVPNDLLRAALRAGDRPVRLGGELAVVSPALPGQPVAVLLTMQRGAGPSIVPYALGVVALAVLLAAGIAFVLARATTRPLEELGFAAARVAGGDLDTPITVRSQDEVGLLAAAFNTMTADLRAHLAELDRSRDEAQATVLRLGEALSGTHDLDRLATVVLDTALASTGARAGALLLVQGAELVLLAGRGLAETPADLHVAVGEGITGGVAASGEAVRGRSGTDLVPAVSEPTDVELVALPLKGPEGVVGVLVLFDRELPFSAADVATLRTFASQATVAVDNVRLHEQAQRQSLTDGLTGVANYRSFQLTVAREIERAARFSRPMALLLLDLDHFKLVNDVHGHQAGDAVLVELAARLAGQVRDVDTLARYGGEEFVVVLPETDEAGAVQAAERIRAAVRRRPYGEAGGPQLDVTVSIGAAVFPDHGATAGSLLRAADEALYAAKASGRDTWRVAAPATPVSSGP